jgi:hypothetical protein
MFFLSAAQRRPSLFKASAMVPAHNLQVERMAAARLHAACKALEVDRGRRGKAGLVIALLTIAPAMAKPIAHAQHHFHEAEGRLPAPFAFRGLVAAQTSRIRLGTGIVTLPLEHPIRVAEDAAVLDLMSNGRFELGVGTGGNPTAFAAFGLDSAQRNDIFARNLDIVRTALAGQPLTALRKGRLPDPVAELLPRRIELVAAWKWQLSGLAKPFNQLLSAIDGKGRLALG